MPIYILFMNESQYWEELGNRLRWGFNLYNATYASSYLTKGSVTVILNNVSKLHNSEVNNVTGLD